jgi:TetR/AcrR family transcriptional repressor of nem operon
MKDGDTRTALLDYAQSLVQRVGVNAMSYNDLSQAVGIRKASIHYHFPKKDDLIRALVERCQTAYGQHYSSIVESDHSARRKLEMIASVFEEGVRNDKLCLIGMLSTEYASLSEPIQDATSAAVEHTTAIFAKAIRQGVREKVIAKKHDVSATAFGFLSFLLGAQILCRCTRNPSGFKKAARAYIESLTTE